MTETPIYDELVAFRGDPSREKLDARFIIPVQAPPAPSSPLTAAMSRQALIAELHGLGVRSHDKVPLHQVKTTTLAQLLRDTRSRQKETS